MVQMFMGDADTFDALAFGEPHPSTFQFLRNEMAAPSAALNQIGQQFMAGAKALYERVSGSAALRTAAAVRRRISGMFQENVVKCLQTIGELQQATPIMQRWLMADPVTRKLYQQQRIDGFSDSYIDVEPDAVGDDHYDYRRVMDGIIEFDADDSWHSTTYLDPLRDEDQHLTIVQQSDILDSWAALHRWYEAYGDDPTSRWNAKLG